MKNDLFDEASVLINYVLRNKTLTITMINIDVTEYAVRALLIECVE